MELANAMLALGGDRATTVPKYGITPAEIAVLCAIHGDDAVFDIEPTGETVERSNTEEVSRLLTLYPAKTEDGGLIVTTVYPGRGAMVHQEIADLGLAESLFKTTERVAPVAKKSAKPKPVAKPEPLAPKNDATALFDEDDVTA